MNSKAVKKSYEASDPIREYCSKHSTPMHPVQLKLIEETLKHSKVYQNNNNDKIRYHKYKLPFQVVHDDG